MSLIRTNTSPKSTAITTGLIPLLLLLSCATTGPGGRRSLILIPESDEIAIGRSLAARVDSTEVILKDEIWQSYLTEVGERIVAVCDRPDLDYQFRVIDSDQINAFAAPGGFLYFYTGILNMMDSEAELAAVMAHEISHVVARHSVKHLQTTVGVSVISKIVLGEEAEKTLGQVVGISLSLAMTGYGRGNELEADEFGVQYMAEAGYNPHAAHSMFTKLAELSGAGGRGFFENLVASHPETQERIKRIDEQIARMPRSVDDLPDYRERYQLLKKRLPEPGSASDHP